MHQEIEELIADLTNGKTAAAFFGIFQGRCTFAAICFAAFGVYGWLHGHDLTSYAAFVTAIQGLLILHSWKEDVAEQKQIESQKIATTCMLCGAVQEKKS